MRWLVVLAPACTPQFQPQPAVSTVPDPPTTPTTPTTPSTTTPPRPAVPAAIYLVMPDRFSNGDPTNDDLGVPSCFDPEDPLRHHGGDWQGLVEHLDYLEELGVDALWITPPYAQTAPTGTSCGYHGYWGDFTDPDDGAVEPRLGTPDDLVALSDALHDRGMQLVLDLVANHSGRGSRLLAERPDWFHDADDCDGSDTPDEDCSLNGLPDFDQDHPDVDAWLRDQTAGWVTRYDVDGVRLDTAKHVPADWLGTRWLPVVTADRDRFVVAEVFDDGGYDRIADYLDAGLPSAFDFPLRKALVDSVAHGGSIDLAASRTREVVERFGIDQANRMVHMLDNHDVQRFTEDVLHRPESEATGRYRLGLAVLATAPGIPQVTWGNELGMRGAGDPDNRRDLPAWAFDPVTRTGDPEGFLPDVGGTFDSARTWLVVRRAHPALSVGSYAELWRQNGSPVPLWAFFRSSGDDRVIVVVHAGTAPSGEMRIKVQLNPDIVDADKDAMPDGVSLVPAVPVDTVARIEDGDLVLDDVPPLTAAMWVVR